MALLEVAYPGLCGRSLQQYALVFVLLVHCLRVDRLSRLHRSRLAYTLPSYSDCASLLHVSRVPIQHDPV